MKVHFALLSLVVLIACGKSSPELENFDTVTWKNDRNGCEGKRSGMIASMQAQTNKLLSLKEMQVVQLLGRPDGNELYERNQKFYYYHFTPGKACAVSDSSTTQLVLRFSAMGVVTEAIVK